MKTHFKSALGLAILGSTMFAQAASADPLPVIAVNREIGLSAMGTFTGVAKRYSDAYSEPGFLPFGSQLPAFMSVQTNNISYYERRRDVSWIPGGQAESQVMFDLGRVQHLYASGTFSIGSGRQHNTVDTLSYDNFDGTERRHGQGTDTRSFLEGSGEIGKGFLLAHDRLLLTPVVQGGYYSYGPIYQPQYTSSFMFSGYKPVDRFTAYGYGYVGLAVHADYALTNRLVLRGRAGWAQALNTHEYLGDYQSDPGNRTRPIWQGSLGADYRFARHWHATGSLQYKNLDYGRANGSTNDLFYPDRQSAHSWTNTINLTLGLAYGF